MQESKFKIFQNALPLIGPSKAIILSIASLIGGIIIGTQLTLWIQGAILCFVAILLLLANWMDYFDSAVFYTVASVILIISILLGDVSYLLQTGLELKIGLNNYAYDICRWFKVN